MPPPFVLSSARPSHILDIRTRRATVPFQESAAAPYRTKSRRDLDVSMISRRMAHRRSAHTHASVYSTLQEVHLHLPQPSCQCLNSHVARHITFCHACSRLTNLVISLPFCISIITNSICRAECLRIVLRSLLRISWWWRHLIHLPIH